jgi:hypothetical protein
MKPFLPRFMNGPIWLTAIDNGTLVRPSHR